MAEADITSALDHAPFTQRHRISVSALLAALIFDYMRPLTISVSRGIRAMWGLTPEEAS